MHIHIRLHQVAIAIAHNRNSCAVMHFYEEIPIGFRNLSSYAILLTDNAIATGFVMDE